MDVVEKLLVVQLVALSQDEILEQLLIGFFGYLDLVCINVYHNVWVQFAQSSHEFVRCSNKVALDLLIIKRWEVVYREMHE